MAVKTPPAKVAKVAKSAKKTSALGAKPSALGAKPSALGELRGKKLPAEVQELFAACEEKIGFVPNVFRAYTPDVEKLHHFRNMYNDLMLADSPLSKLEREMIAVVVSAVNRCHYCLIAHGAAVRALSGDARLGDTLVTNYRAAALDKRQRAMLDFAHKLAATPAEMGAADRAVLGAAGFSDLAIFHIASVVGFFSMSNRVAAAVDMRPNDEYYNMARDK